MRLQHLNIYCYGCRPLGWPHYSSSVTQERITDLQCGPARTLAPCTHTLWTYPRWRSSLSRAWRLCWGRRSSWCTELQWCPSLCWMAEGTLCRSRTKSPEIWPKPQTCRAATLFLLFLRSSLRLGYLQLNKLDLKKMDWKWTTFLLLCVGFHAA